MTASYTVTYATLTPAGDHEATKLEHTPSLESAREMYEGLKQVRAVYWAEIRERESPRDPSIILDSWTR